MAVRYRSFHVRVWRAEPDRIRVTVEDVRSGETTEMTGAAAALVEQTLTPAHPPEPGPAPDSPGTPATTES